MNDQNTLIKNWIQAHGEDFVNDLSRLVAVRSVKADALPGMPYGEECARVLQVAEKIAAGYGFGTKNWDNYVLTADLGPKDRALDILAHLDVVGEGKGWDTDPYTVVLDGDTLYGRGVTDDKGPVAAALLAMRCVKELGLPITKGVRLIMGADEESGSSDIRYYYNIEKPAPGTFTPDAWFPIYNTEKGGYKPTFTMAFDATDALPRVSFIEGGFRTNVLPGDAEAIVLGMTAEEVQPALAQATEETGVEFKCEPAEGGVHIIAHGVQAHASLPEMGNNANTGIINALCRLPLAECGSTKAVRGLGRAFPHGDWEGEALGVKMEDDISGPMTVVFSILNLDEKGMSGQYDSRVPLCANEDNCQKVVESFLGALGFTVTGKMRPGHHTPAEGEFVSTLLGCYEEISGLKGECLAMGGGTYVHNIPGGVAFGPGFPGYDSREHGANERAELSDMLKAAAIYALAIARLCK